MASRSLLAAAYEEIGPTYGLRKIAAELGHPMRSQHWLIDYISGLQSDYGFPAPLPLKWRGKWIEGVHQQSRWSRIAVDSWFHDRLPPDATTAVDNAARASAAAAMDASAFRLFAIDGGRSIASGAGR